MYKNNKERFSGRARTYNLNARNEVFYPIKLQKNIFEGFTARTHTSK